MPVLDAPHGRLEYLLTGSGQPVTVFAHGLAATIAETRPVSSGVLGRRVFFAFRGHGASFVPAEGWDYDGFAADLRAVADHFAATRALGVSLGAAALLRVLLVEPDRFEKLVFFLPAVLDRPRADRGMERLAELADAVERRDVARLEELLLIDLPEGVRELPEALEANRARAKLILDSPLIPLLRGLPPIAPVDDRAALRAITAPALVVGQQGDDVHPAAIAEELAAALPNARLHVFSEAGAMWLARARLREVVAGFLNA